MFIEFILLRRDYKAYNDYKITPGLQGMVHFTSQELCLPVMKRNYENSFKKIVIDMCIFYTHCSLICWPQAMLLTHIHTGTPPYCVCHCLTIVSTHLCLVCNCCDCFAHIPLVRRTHGSTQHKLFSSWSTFITWKSCTGTSNLKTYWSTPRVIYR